MCFLSHINNPASTVWVCVSVSSQFLKILPFGSTTTFRTQRLCLATAEVGFRQLGSIAIYLRWPSGMTGFPTSAERYAGTIWLKQGRCTFLHPFREDYWINESNFPLREKNDHVGKFEIYVERPTKLQPMGIKWPHMVNTVLYSLHTLMHHGHSGDHRWVIHCTPIQSFTVINLNPDRSEFWNPLWSTLCPRLIWGV